MLIEECAIPDVKSVRLSPIDDVRGQFIETFDTHAFDKLGLTTDFVQDVISINTKRGTFRGLHFQSPPHAQATLVRVQKGRIFDVAVDLRRSSSTFGKHVSTVLAETDWRWLFIPAGFAHGFCTLEDNCEVAYKLSDHYAPDASSGINLNDPELDISWPINPTAGILSEKDENLPMLKDAPHDFQ